MASLGWLMTQGCRGPSCSSCCCIYGFCQYLWHVHVQFTQYASINTKMICCTNLHRFPHSAVQFVPIWDERIAKICRLWKAWCYGWCLAQQDLECNWHSLITVDQWWTTWAKDIAKIKQQFILAHYESDRSRIEGKAAAAPFQPTASSALVPRIPDQPRSATEWHQKLFIH